MCWFRLASKDAATASRVSGLRSCSCLSPAESSVGVCEVVLHERKGNEQGGKRCLRRIQLPLATCSTETARIIPRSFTLTPLTHPSHLPIPLLLSNPHSLIAGRHTGPTTHFYRFLRLSRPLCTLVQVPFRGPSRRVGSVESASPRGSQSLD